MDRNAIKNNVKKELSFLGFSDAIINQLNHEFDEIADTHNHSNEEQLTDILISLYYIKSKELLENGNYGIVINYLNSKQSSGKKIFYHLNSFLKEIGVELTFDLGVFLIVSYAPLNEFFISVVEYLNNNKDGELKDIVDDEQADLLFDLYCAKTGVKLGDKELKPGGYKPGFYSEDSVSMYINDITQYPLLTPEEERELFQIYKNSNNEKEKETARKKIINSNLRLVIRLARQYMTRLPYNKIPFLDLIQEGNIGLMKAVDKFDPDKGHRLSTYATWWIRQSISRYIGENGTAIRIPSHLDEKVRRISKISEDYLKEHNRDITLDELSELSGYPKSIVVEAKNILRLYGTAISLDEPVGEDEDTTMKDFIPSLEIVEETVEKRIEKEVIMDVLKTLDDREKEVLIKRFGLNDGFPKTLEEIGAEYGLTRERIRQIEARALRKLKTTSRARVLKEGKPVEIVESPKKSKYYTFLMELKRSPKTVFDYVISGLTHQEQDILIKKVGKGFNVSNYIGNDEEVFANIIIPKIKHRFIRISCNTFTYKGLFEKYDPRVSLENFYLLKEKEQDLLKFAYGLDLSSPINPSITYEDERKIAKTIVPKMNSIKPKKTMRQFRNYEQMYNLDELFLPDYLTKLFIFAFPTKNISSLKDNARTRKNTVDGINFLLEVMLNDNQINYIVNIFKSLTIEEIKREFLNNKKFIDIISIIRSSPHFIYLDNHLYSRTNSKKQVGDLSFYSFFSNQEVKILQSVLKDISFEDLAKINQVFVEGINIPVYRSMIKDDDYYNLIVAIKNIKEIIKKSSYNISNKYNIGFLSEVYRYCDYLFGKPEFYYLTEVLTEKEIRVLADCLSVPSSLSFSIQYAANLRKTDEAEVLSCLTQALKKIYEFLQNDSNKSKLNEEEINLVLKLTNKEKEANY